MRLFIFDMDLGPDADGHETKLVFHVMGNKGEEALEELNRIRKEGKMFDPAKVGQVDKTRVVKVFRETPSKDPLLLFSE